MIHGDLKGVCCRMVESMPHLTRFAYKGQHTDRRGWERAPSRLRASHPCLRPHKPYSLEFIYVRRHNEVDESRTA